MIQLINGEQNRSHIRSVREPRLDVPHWKHGLLMIPGNINNIPAPVDNLRRINSVEGNYRNWNQYRRHALLPICEQLQGWCQSNRLTVRTRLEHSHDAAWLQKYWSADESEKQTHVWTY